MNKKIVKRGFEEDWEYFESEEIPQYEITGKYLFFSPDRKILVKIAKEEILNHEFHLAKIPRRGKNIGDDYVLCLYYKDMNRQHELARRYREWKIVRFKSWKSDADSLSGKYSDKFIDDLNKD